jgi:hypothetical protein
VGEGHKTWLNSVQCAGHYPHWFCALLCPALLPGGWLLCSVTPRPCKWPVAVGPSWKWKERRTGPWDSYPRSLTALLRVQMTPLHLSSLQAYVGTMSAYFTCLHASPFLDDPLALPGHSLEHCFITASACGHVGWSASSWKCSPFMV